MAVTLKLIGAEIINATVLGVIGENATTTFSNKDLDRLPCVDINVYAGSLEVSTGKKKTALWVKDKHWGLSETTEKVFGNQPNKLNKYKKIKQNPP